MSSIQLTAKSRQVPTAEKNQERSKGNLPAELYGLSNDNSHLFLNQLEFEKVYARAGESSLIDLGVDQGEPVKVLVKEVQQDPVTEKIVHVDFYRIDMNKELHTVVPLVFVGESKAVKYLNGILVKSLEEVEVACLPTDLISKIEVDISGLESFNEVIRVSDLRVPETMKILTNQERSVATVVPVKVQVEEAPQAEVAAEGEAAEAEGKEGEKKGDGDKEAEAAKTKTEGKKK